MFGMGMPEVLVILAIALIVLGPKKLPEIAKALGRGIAEFRRATQDLKENLDVDDDLKAAREAFQEIKGDIEGTVKGPTTGMSPENQGQGTSEETAQGTGPEDVEGDVEKPSDTAEKEESEKQRRDETSASNKGSSQHG